jgi:PPOX class probable F420-dependent enzyme
VPDLSEDEARRRFAAARAARLATVDRDGRPHLVPIVFAVEGGRIYSAVDAKPKRGADLRRLANIRAEPRVSLLVDHYAEDWATLWWARADGRGSVVESGPDLERALELLREKYPQYGEPEGAPPIGPAIVVAVERWSGWTAGD